MQREDGSFGCIPVSGEDESAFTYDEGDMRYIYTAVVLNYILDGTFSSINTDKIVEYIHASFSYDGAFGQGPLEEGHGGSTYCALASLALLGKMDTLSKIQIKKVTQWLIMRQKTGFQGRPNKPEDTCYSFWIGASLKILKQFELIDTMSNVVWLLQTQRPIGGFGKWAHQGVPPDPVHSYFGVCGFSLMDEPGLQPLNAPLNISERAAKNLESIRQNSK